MDPRRLLLVLPANLAAACSAEKATEVVPSLELGVEQDITPSGTSGHRPDATVIDGSIYLAYAQQEPGPLRFRLLRLDANAVALGEPSDLYSASGISTDIRVAQDGGRFWYAFESFHPSVVDPCSQHVLGAAIYTPGAEGPVLTTSQFDLTTGCPTTVDFMVDPLPASEMPDHPQAVDDPTPFVHDGELVVLVRAWSIGSDERYNSVQHVYRYDDELSEIGACLLDLAPALEGERLALSQNTLVDIEGQIFLIGGLSDGPPMLGTFSGIYAFPLSDDLCSTSGTRIPLVVGEEYTTRVTASHYADGTLTINYAERPRGPDSRDERGYLASFDVRRSFELVDAIQFQDQTAADNHASFVVLNGHKYVFYQGNPERVLLKIFE